MVQRTVPISPRGTGLPELRPEAFHGAIGDHARLLAQACHEDPAASLVSLLAVAGTCFNRGPYCEDGYIRHRPTIHAIIVSGSTSAQLNDTLAPVQAQLEGTNHAANSRVQFRAADALPHSGLLEVSKNIASGAEPPLIATGELMWGSSWRLSKNVVADYCGFWDYGKPIALIGSVGARELHSARSLQGIQTLGSRCLWCMPQPSPPIGPPETLTSKQMEAFANRIDKCVERAQGLGAMRFNSAAQKTWSERYSTLAKVHQGLSGIVASQARGHVLRAAITCAIADQASEIGVAHLQMGLAVQAYSQASVEAILGTRVDDALSRFLEEALSTGPRSTSELHVLLNGHTRGSRLHEALATSEARGRIKAEIRKTRGRPETIWHLADDAQATTIAKTSGQ